MSAVVEENGALEYKSIAEALYQKLRDEILAGDLQPGQQLSQSNLARRFGISRMPVRDALKWLHVEGLVTERRGQAAVVSQVDLDELVEVSRIRAVLEALAAEMAAPNVTDEDIEKFAKLLDEMEQATQAGDVSRWLRLHSEIHLRSYERCNSERLMTLIRQFWHATHHHRRIYYQEPGAMQRSNERHRRALEALKARDGKLHSEIIGEGRNEVIQGIMQKQREKRDGL